MEQQGITIGGLLSSYNLEGARTGCSRTKGSWRKRTEIWIRAKGP